MKKNNIIWLVIPIIAIAFLYEMAFQGKVPLASDTISIKPISKWVQEYEKHNDEIPQWYPHLFSGMPSYGSYTYTPGDPTASILKTVLFNRGLKYWFHFSFGGLGLLIFFFRKKIRIIPALFGSLTLVLTPYLFGLINAGHSTKIIAIGYIPWILVSIDYCIHERKLRGILYLGIMSALQLWSNHPQVVYYTWLLVGFYLLWFQLFSLKEKVWGLKKEGKTIFLVFAGLLLSLIIVSDPYVSVFEFQKHSNRGSPSVLDTTDETETGTKWEYATQWSFHPKETISFLYPYWFGLQNFPDRSIKSASYWGYMPQTQSTHYLGLLVVLLGVLGAILKKPNWLDLFFWVASGIILIIGFGEYFPVFFRPLFEFAPFFSKFRIPSMIYLLLPITMGYLGGRGLQNVIHHLEDDINPQKTLKWILIVFGGFFGLSLIIFLLQDSFLLFIRNGESVKYNNQVLSQIVSERKFLFNKGLLISLTMAGSGLAILWLGVKKSLSPTLVGMLLIGITIAELWVIDQEFLYLKPANSIISQFYARDVDKFLMKDNEPYRIFPIDQLSTNRYGYFGISSIGGYRPVKLRIYQDLMDTGGLNNFNILNMLNVKYFITSRNIKHPDLEQVFKGTQLIYKNKMVLPKAWIVSGIIPVLSQKESLEAVLKPEFNPAEQVILNGFNGSLPITAIDSHVIVSQLSSNRISLETQSDQSGILVLSEMYYAPGWSVFVDGTEKRIYQANHILRAVEIPAGKHLVDFKYNATLWTTTRWISRIVFIFAIFILIIVHRKDILSLIPQKK
ncbi:MAG: YfhO family protein [Candidatus Marinimicrobia bacterium]|nr:YfhO family protein [Candidatus Neomarinimicrobiota bacterium]